METTTKQISMYVSAKTKKTLDKLCRKTGKSQREIIEAAILSCGPAIAEQFTKSVALRKD